MKKTHWFAAGLVLTCMGCVIAIAQEGATNSSDQTTEKVYTATEVSRKVVIVSNPEPEYTEAARENKTKGSVILYLVLRSNGEVGDIAVLKGLPHGLNETAIEAACNIKFEPAIKDGRPVSQSLKVEYVFTYSRGT